MSTLLFLRDVARSPVQMGAIVPSSKHLARSMVDEAGITPGDVVVELGGGSGAFTREIVARHPGNPLVVFELSAELAGELARGFPSATVVAEPVEVLPEVADRLGLPAIDRVISGLPWALWSEGRQAAILDALVPLLSPTARLVTFHYVHSRALGRVATMRRLLQERFLDVRYAEPVWANVPPAFVHIAERPLLAARDVATQS